MHQFLSVYYFILLLLHVSATMCHPQGARLYLLSYLPIWVFWLIKLCVVCGCVYTTQNFINQKPKLAFKSEGTDELPENGRQLPKHVGAAK
jgi:hypothetical protein